MLRTVVWGKSKSKSLGPITNYLTSFNCSTQTQAVVPEVPKPTRSGLQASYARGTGGRLSFSGNICTILGSTGYLGSYIVESLVKDGTQLVIPYRGDAYDVRHMKTAGDLGQILFFPFNLKDDDSIRKVVKHSNIVINLIGRDFHTVSKFIDDFDFAMNATEHPEEFFIPGGSEVLKTKALGERYVREEFPDAIIVRPSNIHGFEDRFFFNYAHPLRLHMSSRISLYRKGEHAYRSPVHHSDVADGVLQLVRDPTCDGKTYEFVGPHWYLMADLIDYLFRITHRYEVKTYGRQHIDFWMTMKTNFWEAMRIFSRRHIKVDWESVERNECISDLLTGCPTLEDLGVNLSVVEEKLVYSLGGFDMRHAYKPDIGEFPEPPLPKRYPPMYKPTGAKLSEKYQTTTKQTFINSVAV